MKSVNLVASLPYNAEYLPGDFIGVDKGAQYLLEKNIDMIAVVGDFDSIDKTSYQNLLDNNTNIIKLDPIKDNTDLDKAIEYALARGYEAINVYGALGQRVDHTLININLLKRNKMIRLFDETSIIYVLKKGIHQIEINEYKYYSFFAIEECNISLTNFKYPLKNYCLKLDDTLCISNEIQGDACIEIDEDIIVVVSK